ncbi:hypothetical protein KA017_03550 [Candidatus Woesebacteria bacterium]|nr:hypothetical protein [Candidatus Woesebacteria bacterium]
MLRVSQFLEQADAEVREEQIAARKELLRKQFVKIESRIKKAWALHKKNLRKGQPELARTQKLAVFDELFDFFSSMYASGLLIYLNGQFVKPEEFQLYKQRIDRTRVDNFTQDLFAWFALTLGLVEVDEIKEMVGHITQKFAETVPTDAEVQQFIGVVNSGRLLN